MRLVVDHGTDAFRAELVSWLDANQPDHADVVADPPASTGHIPPWAAKWQAALFDAGWLVPGWPPDLGGRNASPHEQMVYFEELARRRLKRSTSTTGVPIVAPAIVELGTPEQRERWAIPLLRGEISSCLGMSEPGSGSDLASLTTRAVAVGDGFRITGQKVWTSGAQHAALCMCYARTDPAATRHRGISTFLLDMSLPGITTRPIPSYIDPDGADFNEVFLDDVLVPADALLGELHGGWAVATSSLAHERAMVWTDQFAELWHDLEAAVTRSETAGDHRADVQLASSYADASALRVLGHRSFAKLSRGRSSPEQSILKLFGTEAAQQLKRARLDAAGPTAWDLDANRTDLDGPNAASGWFRSYLRSFSQTIAAGTSEIQRNIIAERILGLPR